MAPIRLFDRLLWRPLEEGRHPGFALRYDGSSRPDLQAGAPCDSANLVWRAAELLAREAGIAPYGEFVLTKRIPVRAGLGGGSSDAAAALVLANSAWGLNYPVDRLSALAAQLGSDVPFFLAGGSAICRGRGELVESLPHLPPLQIVLVAPSQGVSTAAAFQALGDEPNEDVRRESPCRLSELVATCRRGALHRAGRLMFNRLQPAAASLSVWVERLGTAFASTACHAHLLTGSGSAYFGVMQSARHARQVAAQLSSANLGTVYASSTCH
jgi:4-diphosphocytidyl-2-C-methyl-D-erythritol kinase